MTSVKMRQLKYETSDWTEVCLASALQMHSGEFRENTVGLR